MNIRASLAAEHLPRRLFTVAEVERMVEAGLMHEDERVELLAGELVPMSPKGNQHELVKAALIEALVPALLQHGHRTIPETTLRLARDTSVEPDFLVFPRRLSLHDLNGETALLAIEIADSSLAYDLGLKPKIYAHYGVRELWVIDAVRLVTHIHRAPGGPLGTGYGDVSAHPPSARLNALAVPGLALSLADFDLAAL